MAINAKLPDNMTPHAKELYDKCDLLSSENDLPEIIRLLEEAMSECPDSEEIIIRLASSYRLSGSIGKAIKLLETTAEKNGTGTGLDLELANSYAERKWNKKAKQKYSECLEASDINTEMIQEIAESCLDMGEYEFLGRSLSGLIEKASEPFDHDTASVCMAMIYAMINECSDRQAECEFSTDFIRSYSEKHKDKISADFYIDTLRCFSQTPNEATVLPLFRSMVDAIVDIMPEIAENSEFQKALVEFELSVVLFTNDVTPFTLLAMRNSKEFMGTNDENRDEIHYLIFDAALALIDAVAQKHVTIKDAEAFAGKYVYLWQLIYKLTKAVFEAPDLRQFFQNYVYSNMKDATPGFCEQLKKNMPAEQYEKIMLFKNAKPVSAPVRSAKISPNAPCPCGSGKKYKKCCGLNH